MRLWRHAATQKNAEACVKVGDYAFYGKGSEFRQADGDSCDIRPDLHWLARWFGGFVSAASVADRGDCAAAARQYHAAAELRHPQAMWNLGWMYQWGVGVPHDPHLSKRHFDLAVSTHPDAKWPGQLGLASLRATMALLSPATALQPDDTHGASALPSHQTDTERDAEHPRQDDEEETALGDTEADDFDLWAAFRSLAAPSSLGGSLMDELMATDTLAVLVLTAVLVLVLQLRRHQHDFVQQLDHA